MSKDSEMYVNDSKGHEPQAKESYQKILDVFASTDGWSQEKLAEYLKINSTTLRKYRREGTVSLYTSKRLSELLNLERGYFNGSLPVTDDIKKIIQDRLTELVHEKLNTPKVKSPIDVVKQPLISLLRVQAKRADAFDGFSLDELEDIIRLLKSNLMMAEGRAQIVRVVQSNQE